VASGTNTGPPTTKDHGGETERHRGKHVCVCVYGKESGEKESGDRQESGTRRRGTIETRGDRDTEKRSGNEKYQNTKREREDERRQRDGEEGRNHDVIVWQS
jgi:hypothetical protein